MYPLSESPSHNSSEKHSSLLQVWIQNKMILCFVANTTLWVADSYYHETSITCGQEELKVGPFMQISRRPFTIIFIVTV